MDRWKDRRADAWARRAGWTDGGACSARCGRTDGTVVLAPLAVDGWTDGRIRMDGPGRIGGWTYGEWTDGWADGQKEGRPDGWADGRRMDGRLDGQTEGRVERMGGRTDGTVVLAPLAADGRLDGRIPWPPKITYINATPSPLYLLKKSIKFTELASPMSFFY